MIASKKLQLDILKYLRNVYRESPLKNVRGNELIDYFNIDDDTFKVTLRFLKDMGLINVMSSDYGRGAMVRITEKGMSEIEDIQE